MKSLIEQAKAIPGKRVPGTVSTEQIDLAIAWANGEVTISQIEKALYGGKSGGMSSYILMARALRDAVRVGKLKVETKHK